uniref:UBC core domain-containing protein n=1 Tax=Rhodosorus marinus TaxID=101924 RepID=A0A7S3E5L5_9RHOD|mmetsp:Transcript_10839/g.45132  ORF Transcript_10839/g.45132 Transcript_10839/m.45132 type:complete len:235 (+) Transcript_10839:222-926(+)
MSACAVKRLAAELRGVERDPPPYITPRPLPSDILKWYFVIRGPKDTPYETGIYMGKLVFPEDYPFKPPAIYMCTPNGRFRTNVKLCLSMSDFHPETWNPVWSVSAVLTGLLSFMVGTEDTFGSIGTSEFEKIKMAKCSHEFNQKDRIFKELFPDFIRNGVERGIPGGTSGDSAKTESSSVRFSFPPLPRVCFEWANTETCSSSSTNSSSSPNLTQEQGSHERKANWLLFGGSPS